MVKGIFFDEDGTVQQFGDVVVWAAIIQSIEKNLPQLHVLHKSSLPAQQLSEEELEQLLSEKRKAKQIQDKEEK